MNSNAILWAVPFYLLVIALELIISLIQNKKLYDKVEFISNVSCGIVQQIGDAVMNLLMIPIYIYFYENFAIAKLDSNLTIFIFLLLYKDFIYYWTHRLTHHSPLWSIHLVHHQPKYFNFSVGLRMPLFHYIIDFIPMMVAAILGFNVQTYILTSVVFASVQIFNHTTYIKNEIPIFSWFFSTPSFHRVHHATNSIYLNKNFGALLSIWDRLFDTYQKELLSDPVIFGVTNEKDYNLNPVEANFIYWKKDARNVSDVKSYIINNLVLLGPALLFIAFAKNIPMFMNAVLAILLLSLYFILSRKQLW